MHLKIKPLLAASFAMANRSVEYDSLPGIGVGITGRGMSEAIVIGAFAFALN